MSSLLDFPLYTVFLFCLKWRECWFGSEPSVIVIITWNINANEEVCRRVNEVSVMWLSASLVHRRTSVVFIWTSHFFKLSLWFVAYRFVFVGVSHDFIIKRATLSLVFLSGNKRQRYFTSHLIPGLWKPSPFEVAVVWMCHWKLIRYSWLEVENVLWPWYQGFSYAALSFCQKNLSGWTWSFLFADYTFFSSHRPCITKFASSVNNEVFEKHVETCIHL